MQAATIRKLFSPELVLAFFLMIFLLPFCGFIFGCGCSFLWSDALKHCSIYDPMRPDCPWCLAPAGLAGKKALSFLFQMIPFMLIYFAGLAVLRVVRHFRGPGYWRDLAVGVMVFVITGILIGWVYAQATGYPQMFRHFHPGG
jgi:hypothetical protein